MSNSRPKVRIARALGTALTPKAAKIMERRPSTPGQHGLGRRKSPSVYKTQLVEKQKLKATYNVSEKQLEDYFKKAAHSQENTGDVLLQILESRADSAVLRMGFAKTIYAARQYVTHGHFNINGKRTKTPSQRLKAGDVISVREKSKLHPQIVDSLTNSQDIQIPEYYELNKVQMEGKFAKTPVRDLIPVIINEQLVVEYYSR